MLHNVLIYISFTSTYLLLGKYSLNTLMNVAALFGHLESVWYMHIKTCVLLFENMCGYTYNIV